MLPLAAVFTSAVFIPATPDCPPDNPLEKNVIPVDVSAIKEIKLPTENTQRIILGDDDHGMLGSVKNIYLQDSFLYVDHPEKISIYDYSGAFHGNISSQGRAANEYLNLWYSWVDDDALYIYDLNGKKIIQYSFLLKKNKCDRFTGTNEAISIIDSSRKQRIYRQTRIYRQRE
ncbi:MAG: 6-bladed beta-propeller [Lachnoclostridium sp.]|nr:6-bladed beta-propeller [Lachnoclostridium sp.]